MLGKGQTFKLKEASGGIVAFDLGGVEHRYEIGPTNCGHGDLSPGDILAVTRDFDRDFNATRESPKGCGCVFNFFAISN